MRTFIIRARKGTTNWERLKAQVGSNAHIEVVAHVVMNAFFTSSDFRDAVEVYIVLDASADFPRTIRLSSSEGLSIGGFHEQAVLQLIEDALKKAQGLQKNETRQVAPGVEISGFGFDKLVGQLLETRTVYLLERKGESIKTAQLVADPVFLLSDHLAMPKKSVAGFMRRGLKTLSLGKKMLFASQCVVIIHYEMDHEMTV
ncbi:MAG: tRNA (pseudouridine(54)-N(1))-methyltransferase TrmY [Gammaproteobacteria bacterium]|nr:tRNA (pseudouridine(54)-N(1))-methyltransferase TrmY [Gammaproteobacteria bacterium]